MTKTRSELKTEAKQMLKGRWGSAILLNLIPTLIALAIATIMGVTLYKTLTSLGVTLDSLATSTTDMTDVSGSGGTGGGSGFFGGLLAAVFSAGISWTYLDLLRNRKQTISPFSDAFRAFKSPFLWGVIALYVLTSLFTFFWALLLIIPGIIKSFAYSQSYFIYYDVYEETGNKMGFLDTITASRRLMNGHKMELFVLYLSFIPWYIVATLTLGIGYLWLNPYVSATTAAFYDNLKVNALD
ncbi:DUF975 family protein [Vagococcus sp. BWB3-3]|uniref:DUF975 family protein n=1 Tax=Vagococcus allomyrinae TaxID=2794353 RepID=A0A940SWH9_9ENTE|nr:DUF975 family protein [Vagococcus allomyrinae]MBP1042146.1 DUF975 family protein [Vagococcus allomyrinae]